MVITIYDIKHKIIPDTLVVAFGFMSFLSMFVNSSGVGSLLAHPALLDMCAGVILALPFALIWYFSGGRAMGLGDSKLIIGIGFMLGLSRGTAALMLAFWIGSVVSLLVMFLNHKKVTLKTEIPFAPFLVIGTILAFFFNIGVFQIASFFSS